MKSNKQVLLLVALILSSFWLLWLNGNGGTDFGSSSSNNFTRSMFCKKKRVAKVILQPNATSYSSIINESTKNYGLPEDTAEQNSNAPPEPLPTTLMMRAIFKPEGPKGRVLFAALSVYQTGSFGFAIIGASCLAIQTKSDPLADSCLWRDPITNEDIEEVSAVTYHVLDHHNMPYESVVVRCNFNSEALQGKNEGRLYLRKGNLPLVRMSEAPNRLGTFPTRDVYDIVMCTPPVHDHFSPHVIREWMDYHVKVVDRTHFYGYIHEGLDEQALEDFNLINNPKEITWITLKDVSKFTSWYFHQATAMHDCLYRARYVSRWAAFVDFDEFIFFKSTNGKLNTFLKDMNDVPWMTMGSIYFNLSTCSPPTSENTNKVIQRMVYRQKDVHCLLGPSHQEVCINYFGHRKHIVNTHLSKLIRIHLIVLPIAGGINWNANPQKIYPKLAHFSGSVASNKTCRFVFDESLKVINSSHNPLLTSELVFDDSIKRILLQ